MRLLISAVALVLMSSAVPAVEITKGHPDYKPLLEESRPILEHEGADFRVLRLWASDRWGFLCALGEHKDGTLTHLGGNPEVFLVVLERTFGGWQQADAEVGFVESPEGAKARCRFHDIDTTGELSDELIERALKGSDFHNLMWQVPKEQEIALPQYFFGTPAESVPSLIRLIDVLRKTQRAAPEEVRSAFQYDEVLAIGRLARQYSKLGDKAKSSAETKRAVLLGRVVLHNPAWSATDLTKLLNEIDANQRTEWQDIMKRKE